MRASGEPGRDLVVMRLGPARFGVWIDEVLEVVPTPPISRLPLPHREVAGVTSVRGDVLPVLDLGVRLLGVPAVRPGRLVLIRHEDTGSLVGLLVDDADLLLAAKEEEIQPPPAATELRLPAEMVMGVVAREDGVVTVLHIGRTAAPPVPATEER